MLLFIAAVHVYSFACSTMSFGRRSVGAGISNEWVHLSSIYDSQPIESNKNIENKNKIIVCLTRYSATHIRLVQ